MRTETRNERLNKIATSNKGRLTPELVWHDAADEDSPLHNCIEWDSTKAAYQHQLDQCRTLIRSVKIVITNETTKVVTVAYIRDPDAGSEQGYVAIAKLKTSREKAVQALRIEIKRANSVMYRMQTIASALDLEGEVQKTMDKLDQLHKLVEEV